MKIGVSLYSFHAYAGEDSLGMKGCIAKAKEIGCEGVDFVETQHESQEAYLAHAREIGAYCREMGVEAVCFCVGSDFLNGSGGDVDAEIARVKGRVDIAAAYGCKLMRHDATPGYPNDKKFGRSFDAVLPILTKAYREVTEYAEQKGVKTCIENPRLLCAGCRARGKAHQRRWASELRRAGRYRQLRLRGRGLGPLGRHYGAVCLPFACEGFP